jgi:Na+-driven multidrug efflux pump
MKYTLVSQAAFGFILMLFPTAYISIFKNDPALHDLGQTWFQIMAIGYMAMGLGTVLTQCLNTAGDTMIPAIVNMVSIWLIQLPVAIFLRDVLDWDSTAVAWAIVLCLLVRLLIYIPYFLSNRWMRAKVLD